MLLHIRTKTRALSDMYRAKRTKRERDRDHPVRWERRVAPRSEYLVLVLDRERRSRTGAGGGVSAGRDREMTYLNCRTELN